ncbi:MAG: glycogen synthase GlgA [Acidobacteriota bacterium]|nr:glycogen synthase GlgA [Acidobacteriota bacterium]
MQSDRPLRIVMLAAEAAPFAKVGGLGDVLGALPKALEKLGVRVAVVIPAYRTTLCDRFKIQFCSRASGFDVPMKSDLEPASVFQTRFAGTGVDLYLIGSRKYFDRDGIYDDPDTREGYADNMQRFIFFMKAAVELLPRLDNPVDIIHCHDSHTALVPGLIRMTHAAHPFYAGVRTLLTIHNLAYQGIYSKEALDYAGIDSSHFSPMSPYEFYGNVNFLKAGIQLADKVNTVSPTYSREIQTSAEMGMGLEGVLRGRKDDLSGIINGIDYAEWNPETDPLIPARYSHRDLTGRMKCRKRLLEHFGLPQSHKRIPLIGIVSRLADQKGFDLIEESIEAIAALDLQLVVLGTGQQKYHDFFQTIAARFPDKIAVRLAFDNAMAHWVEAGCDMFLMPSRFEPCGLNQLYSFRYGTVPIVRATGGLADTVSPYDGQHGTGFIFRGYSSLEMVEAIKQALRVYADPARWQDLTERIMKQDWSWDKSAHQYMQLYESILSRKPSEV